MNLRHFIPVLFALSAWTCSADSSMELLKRSQSGDPAAMRQLGVRMLTGDKGAPRDPKGGIAWLKKAVACKEPAALAAMGDLYVSGQFEYYGIAKNHKKAAELYAQAHARGYKKLDKRVAKLSPSAQKSYNSYISKKKVTGTQQPSAPGKQPVTVNPAVPVKIPDLWIHGGKLDAYDDAVLRYDELKKHFADIFGGPENVPVMAVAYCIQVAQTATLAKEEGHAVDVEDVVDMAYKRVANVRKNYWGFCVARKYIKEHPGSNTSTQLQRYVDALKIKGLDVNKKVAIHNAMVEFMHSNNVPLGASIINQAAKDGYMDEDFTSGTLIMAYFNAQMAATRYLDWNRISGESGMPAAAARACFISGFSATFHAFGDDPLLWSGFNKTVCTAPSREERRKLLLNGTCSDFLASRGRNDKHKVRASHEA